MNRPIIERNIAVCIVLSIITCGIYGLYWLYTVADFYESERPGTLPTTAGLTILVVIVTGGIYGIYAYYQWGKAMPEIAGRYNVYAQDNGVLYLILDIIGLGIVNTCLIQNDINQIARAPYNGPQQNGPYNGPQQNGPNNGPQQNGSNNGPQQNGPYNGPQQNGPQQNGPNNGPTQY